MKKYILLLIVVSLSGQINAQNGRIATINGIYDGYMSVNEILNNPKIEITGDTNYQFINLTLSRTSYGFTEMEFCSTMSFSNPMMNFIQNLEMGAKIFFHSTIKINNDTIELNPVIIRISNKKSDTTKNYYSVTKLDFDTIKGNDNYKIKTFDNSLVV